MFIFILVKRRRICIPEILKALCDSEIMHCEGISREAAGRFLWKQCHRLFLLSLCGTSQVFLQFKIC